MLNLPRGLLLFFIVLFFSVPAFSQQAPVDLGNDLPWLSNNNTGFQPSYNVSGPRAPEDGSVPIDSEARFSGVPEEGLVDQPSNNMPFLVDRTLDRNYIDKQYARFKVLDKVTAKISTVDAKVGEKVKFGWIDINVKAAKKTPPEEEPEVAAFLEVTADKFKTKDIEDREKVFTGFIFASSPSISGLEHPRYDIRLFDALNEDELNPPKAEVKTAEKAEEKKEEADKKDKPKEDQEKAKKAT